VAVTAGDSKGQIADYANSGSFVDVVAPSGTVINYQGQPFFVSGTSASTALVTGTAAGQADANGKSLTEVEADLRAGSAVGSNASR
jgi:subtilisin family serine protease